MYILTSAELEAFEVPLMAKMKAWCWLPLALHRLTHWRCERGTLASHAEQCQPMGWHGTPSHRRHSRRIDVDVTFFCGSSCQYLVGHDSMNRGDEVMLITEPQSHRAAKPLSEIAAPQDFGSKVLRKWGHHGGKGGPLGNAGFS